jgi:hypothetical protein
MKENKILASVALFSELYDNKKDIYDVIGEFIKAAIVSEAKWTFNPSDVSQLLKKTFDFKLPDGVIKSVLKNRLKRDGVVAFDNGFYTLTSDEIKKEDKLTVEFTQAQTNYSKTFEDLISYLESKQAKKLSENEKEELNSNFNAYLLGDNVSDKYLQYISFFIIQNQTEPHFTERLNAIKEGLILYTGIRYTADLNDLGTWNSEMTIFLDTEHLFNAVGYNGVLYSEIFDDFFKLVNDINQSSKNKGGKKKIELKYFDETKTEVDGFFYVGEKIVEGQANLNPAKTAMQSIVNGCKTPSEILAKKSKFFQELKYKGINQEEKIDYYKNHDYTVEGEKVLDSLKKQSAERNKFFDEEECSHYLKLFTKINALRKGVSSIGFERTGYILLSGNNVAHFLAHNNAVKINERDIPFATDIDFITDKFWFKLKKGFSDKTNLPRTFDIITKAQIVLSSQLKHTVSTEYVKLTDKFKRGEITKEQAISLNYDLRERAIKPEDITVAIIDDSLAFLNDDNIAKHLQEKSILLRKVEEGEQAKEELRKRDAVEWVKKKKPAKILTWFEFYSLFILFHLLLSGFATATIYLIYKLSISVSNITDSIADIIGLCCLVVFEIFPLLKYRKIVNWIFKRRKIRYQKYLQKLKDNISLWA